MDALVHEFAERGVDSALAGDARLAGEAVTFDDQREVAFAALVMAGVAAVVIAFVDEVEAGWGERGGEATVHLGRDGASVRGGGGRIGHGDYIGRLNQRGIA